MMAAMLISVVIPCYYSEKTIAAVVEKTIDEFRTRNEYDCEFVLVNDGSTDKTFDEIQRLSRKYPFVKGVDLLRNFGQHNALLAALHFTSGDYILGMDDDMQTHPSQIFKLIDKIQNGYDLVYGHYPKRQNSPAKNLSSKINEVTSRILLGRPKNITSSNFWIITRQIATEARKYDGYNPYIDGIFYRLTNNIANVDVEHHERAAGNSGYTFRKLLRLWLAYWNYSVVPLRISSVLGLVVALIGFCATIFLIINKILDPTMVLGWSSLACLLCLFFGITLMIIGVMGEYIGKIILSINHTPQYIVKSTVNISSDHE